MENRYRIIERKCHILREDELQRILEEGWELVSVVNTDYAFYFYFKRIL